MAASFDNNGDVELNCELRPGKNMNYASLAKQKGKLTPLTWVLIVIILGLGGIIIYLATTVSNLKNEEHEAINVEISSCGGIINVEMNRTTQIKLGHVGDNFEKISCTWILKSDAKMVNLQWINTDINKFPLDKLLIGELSLTDEELHCTRTIEGEESWSLTNIVSTPAILHFTSAFRIRPLNFEVKLIPVTSGGSHESQPQTYYVNTKPTGSLKITNDRPDSLLGMVSVFENNDDRQLECSGSDFSRGVQCCDSVEAYSIISSRFGRASCTKVPVSNLPTNDRPDSLLGMVTVFENNDDRQLKCSDLTRAVQCCDSVEAYSFVSIYRRTSCTKVLLSNLATQMSSYGTVVILAPTHGLCQFHWTEA